MSAIRLGAVFFLIFDVIFVGADYATNPFLQGGSPLHHGSETNSKDLNQLNVAVVLPPGEQIAQQPQYAPSQATPGFVWLQVPITQGQISQTAGGSPSIVQPPHITPKPAIQQPVTSVHLPPKIPDAPHSGELNKYCLRPNGVFPSGSCKKFVNCGNGVATEQTCVDGLLFNPKGYCDYAANVNCNEKHTQGPTPTTATTLPGATWTSSKAPPTSRPSTTVEPAVSGVTSATPAEPTVTIVNPHLRNKCLKPRGQFPSASCNKFVNCWDGIAVEQECPTGLLFSSKGYCDYPHNVNCGDRETSIKASTPSECPLETGTFRDSSSCDTYHTCVANKIVATYVCAVGFKFNDNIGVCDYEDKVDCSKEPALNQWGKEPALNQWGKEPASNQLGNKHNGQSASQQASTPSECPLESGTFRDRSRCDSYFTCKGNKIVASYACPQGFKFNDNLGICDYEDRVDCSKEPSVNQWWYKNNEPSVNQNASGQSTECPIESGTFRDKNNCNHYYTCLRHEVVARYECPEGFLYNVNIGVCDYSSRVNCNEDQSKFLFKQNILPQLPTDLITRVNNCTPGTVFRLNPQCTAACLCRNGVAEIVQCPTGTAYDSSTDKCVPPHLARC